MGLIKNLVSCILYNWFEEPNQNNNNLNSKRSLNVTYPMIRELRAKTFLKKNIISLLTEKFDRKIQIENCIQCNEMADQT